MPKLPSIDASDVVRAFEALGWTVARQRGSHIIMVRDGHMATLSIPDHNPVARGTLRSLVRAAGLTVDEFVAALS
jgi:predicted RNA binding protein YcfA (HicA-like mRNA interferase family)